MTQDGVASIIRALNESEVRYLVAGGLAVVAHGYLRMTVDVDLIVELTAENLLKIGEALRPLGYTPRIPEPIERLADDATRERWINEKHMVVFSLVSAADPLTIVDLFVNEPLDFEAAYSRADWKDIRPDLTASFVCYEDLVALKRMAGRPQDLADIWELEERRS